MNPELENEVLKTLKNHFSLSSSDSLVLVGSRALGKNLPDSDIDTFIFTDELKSYKEVFINSGFIKKGEDLSTSFKLNSGLTLEVKIFEYSLPSFDVLFFNEVLKSKTLVGADKLNDYKNKVQSSFDSKYNELLMYQYIHFFNQFKQLEGIAKRQEYLSKYALHIVRGTSLQSFLRLVLVIQKQIYPSDKWLVQVVSESKLGEEAMRIADNFLHIESTESVKTLKSEINSFINCKMPNEPYVGSWWKYLNKYRNSGFYLYKV